jgi:hypothetical protein
VRTGKNRRLTLAKLALLGFSVALAIGAGACVADDPSTSAKVFSDDITATNIVNELELPTMGDDNIDPQVVVVTGLDWPGHTPLQPNIDMTNVDILELDPNARSLCAVVSSLPNTDVCSSLCDPNEFTARVFGGSTGCTTQTCELPGGATATVDVCN